MLPLGSLPERVCWYQDQKYSLGSRIQQGDLWLECGPQNEQESNGPLAWREPACLLDYLPAATLVAVDERRQCLAHARQWLDHATQHRLEVLASDRGGYYYIDEEDEDGQDGEQDGEAAQPDRGSADAPVHPASARRSGSRSSSRRSSA